MGWLMFLALFIFATINEGIRTVTARTLFPFLEVAFGGGLRLKGGTAAPFIVADKKGGIGRNCERTSLALLGVRWDWRVQHF